MQNPDYPIKVTTVDLAEPLTDIENLYPYAGVQVLIRLHGAPVGYIRPPITNGRVRASDLIDEILSRHSDTILRQLLRNGLSAANLKCANVQTLFNEQSSRFEPCPFVTVAVCTRDRTDDLARCLEALIRLEYPNYEILVIDNAPSSRATEDLIQRQFPEVRYFREERPGLDWARNRAAVEGKGEIIAYTDDDVIVDPLWLRALSRAFIDYPEAAAVTGLVAPFELENRAQVLFEMYGGFGRGFQRRLYSCGRRRRVPWRLLGAGQFGTGANMAFRRSFFEQAGPFDPALDVGTVTNGGGDLEMFFRVLKTGHALVYEPNALVFHRHRREYSELRTQLANNGVGLYAYFRQAGSIFPEEIPGLIRLGVWWLYYWHLKRLCRSCVCAWRFPRELILSELWGSFVGIRSYTRAREISNQVAERFGPGPARPKLTFEKRSCASRRRSGTAVRTVDLSLPVRDLSDVEEYDEVQVFLFWETRPLGHVTVQNHGETITSSRLIDVAVDRLGTRLFDPFWRLGDTALWVELTASLRYHLTGRPATAEARQSSRLPASVTVSIVVATYDRPEELRVCLQHLQAQVACRAVEIIVIDNHPSSGLTSPVVEWFPDVLLVNEPRQGSSYARNAGILAATGDIVVTTDDDVRMPSNWLENLIAPFAKAGVMAVTGNVLPLELETLSQRHFETYGGLGRGYQPREFTPMWFERFRRGAVPTWALGGTANAAFRRSVFHDPRIGLMDEVLGPGMPSGVGEDTYLFYRILKCGYTIEYEPAAWVWHKHRNDMKSLKRQIYNYSKGHVSYHMVTAIRDGDFRALFHIGFHLPRIHLKRVLRRLRRTGAYPLSLILLEIWGNIVGPFALLRSALIVRKQGRSNVKYSNGLTAPVCPTRAEKLQLR